MTSGFYRIRLTRQDGHSWIWLAWAKSDANAYWIASQIHPSCQIEVLGVDESI